MMASFSSAYASGSPTPSSTSAHSLASDGNNNSAEPCSTSSHSPEDLEYLSSTCAQYEHLIHLYARRLISLRALIPPTSDPAENVAAYEIVETEVCFLFVYLLYVCCASNHNHSCNFFVIHKFKHIFQFRLQPPN